VFVCDVAGVAVFQARLTDIEKSHRRIDVLVNDAGIDMPTLADGPTAPRRIVGRTVRG
jgi:short-subunit dehydrogenase involved in D-alanine esterification of teichoic acids